MKSPEVMIRTTVLALLLGASAPSWAQYAWTDANGHKQYSDMPPPSSVPRGRILKQPGGVTPALKAPVDDEGKVPPPASPAKVEAQMTLAERNADYQKRKTEQADSERKAADAARIAADRAANCEKMQGYGRALSEGVRIGNIDAKGERTYLSDEQRAVEVQKNQRAVKDCR